MSRGRVIRCVAWSACGALVILLGRTIAYALDPAPIAQLLQHRAGGPALPVVALVSLGLALLTAACICVLASVGVRERALLERRTLTSSLPRIDALRVLGRAAALWAVVSPLGGLLEAYIHWRAGLGWHGLHCLVGPVHRDLLPIFGALSLIASAVGAAVEHVVSWMRRTAAGLAHVRLALPPAPTSNRAPLPGLVVRPLNTAAGGPRAPPLFS
jgi:hypothetical protein